MSVNIKKL